MRLLPALIIIYLQAGVWYPKLNSISLFQGLGEYLT